MELALTCVRFAWPNYRVCNRLHVRKRLQSSMAKGLMRTDNLEKVLENRDGMAPPIRRPRARSVKKATTSEFWVRRSPRLKKAMGVHNLKSRLHVTPAPRHHDEPEFTDDFV